MEENPRIRELESRLQNLESELFRLKTELAAISRGAEPVLKSSNQVTSGLPVSVQQQEVKAPIADRPVKKNEFSWERFVGEQLLSKIGILILIAGLIIGAKIAIDKNLIGSGMKVAGGFLISAILFFLAWRLFRKFQAYSAVLFAGSMAAAYFISYAGFVFYHLYPYWLAFLLLLIFTCITVAGALRYNLQVIAHIGLLAAYILPGIIAVKPAHLGSYLAYMAVINAGILTISVLRNWKVLSYSALGWTFMVMLVWFATSYVPEQDHNLALIYALVYLLLFHFAAIANTIYEKRVFAPVDLWLAIPNMVLWMIVANGAMASDHFSRSAHFVLLGGTALFYALTAFILRQIRREELFPFRAHLMFAISALTLALMVRINGENLYIVLVLEALIFYWFSVTSSWQSLRVLSLVLVLLASLEGLMMMTFWGYDQPFFSMAFIKILIGMILTLSAGVFLQKKSENQENWMVLMGYIQLFLFLIIQLFKVFLPDLASQLTIGYSMLMIGALRFLFDPDNKSAAGMQTSSLTVTCLLAVLGAILVSKSNTTGLSVFAHYLTLLPASAIIYWIIKTPTSKNAYVFAQLLVLWAISFELLFWLNVSGSDKGYRLLLSLIWTSYAIFLIYSGIRKRIAGSRISGMIILGITILKLFFYDLSRLSGLSKTFVMIVTGGLLLLGAFFYQRFMKETGEESTD